jgi:branched-chain amino acid transport system ATP-binding protein
VTGELEVELGNALLSVAGLLKSFGGLEAVSNLDLDVYPGEIVGLIGPNGAGKTTTFNLLTGFLRPDKGEILLNSQSVLGLKPYEICRLGMSRTFQLARPMYGLTIWQNATVGALNRIHRLKDAFEYSLEILELVGIAEFKDTPAEKLPIGYRKALELAKCLATKPRLILLDEVMSGLNPSEMSFLLEKIVKVRDGGVTVLLIEHVMDAVLTVSDRIAVLNYGVKISEGSPKEVCSDPGVIEAYLGEELEV